MTRRFLMASISAVCLLFCGLVAQAQQRAYRGPYQTVRQVILRLENRANFFRNSMDNSSRSSATYGTTEDISTTITEFNGSVRRLRDSFDRRRATTFEVQDVLTRASRIDDFVRRNSIDTRAQSYWSCIKVDLNTLASAFNLTWQTSGYNPPSTNPGGYGNQYGYQ